MIRFNLDQLLEKNNMTMYQLSRSSGVRPNTISQWAKNEDVKSINKDSLNAICKALKCSVGELIEYIDEIE
jgi:putative transcriptional regulator